MTFSISWTQTKYDLRFCSLVAMLPRLKKNRRKAEDVPCLRFQSECNKVEIALRVMQFWSEIKFVVTNRARRFGNHKFDFKLDIKTFKAPFVCASSVSR